MSNFVSKNAGKYPVFALFFLHVQQIVPNETVSWRSALH
jgi:hypothetical protein